MKPGVSVLTATWQRPLAMRLCRQLVQYQTQAGTQHIVVHDGPEDFQQGEISLAQHAESEVWFGAKAWSMAMWCADTEWSCILQDHDIIPMTYVAELVEHATRSKADFVYPTVVMRRNGQEWRIGQSEPACGQVTVGLFRTELREVATMGEGRTNDWDMFSKWIASGARTSWASEALYWHNVDH